MSFFKIRCRPPDSDALSLAWEKLYVCIGEARRFCQVGKSKDQGARMKDEPEHWSDCDISSFILHPFAFILTFNIPPSV